MILRYLVLFGGIVLMITGCNSLISQNFGTHRLRTLPLEEVRTTGFGDADFVEIPAAEIGEAFIIGEALYGSDKHYVLGPVLSPTEAEQWHAGGTITTNLIAWWETRAMSETAPPITIVRGLVSEPTPRKNPTEQWANQRIQLAEKVAYVQLGEEPMAWYWNIALLLGGLLLAILPEARRYNRDQER